MKEEAWLPGVLRYLEEWHMCRKQHFCVHVWHWRSKWRARVLALKLNWYSAIKTPISNICIAAILLSPMFWILHHFCFDFQDIFSSSILGFSCGSRVDEFLMETHDTNGAEVLGTDSWADLLSQDKSQTEICWACSVRRVLAWLVDFAVAGGPVKAFVCFDCVSTAGQQWRRGPARASFHCCCHR